MAGNNKNNGRYHFPWRQGNQFEMLVDSVEFYPSMLQAIEQARQHILLEMYLIESGSVADRFIHALQQAADRGIRVFLLIDDFGSTGLKQADREKLDHPGISTVYYNPLRSYNLLYNLYRIYFHHAVHRLHRDHRKLLLVDDTCAFVGGAGITEDFNSSDSKTGWRENMLKIRGPVLKDWQRLFFESWNKYAQTPYSLPDIEPVPFENGESGRVTVNVAYRRSGIKWSLYKHIYNASHRVWFSSAYFLPSWRLQRLLKRAALNGVDVRLLLPGPITDHPGVRHGSHHYYRKLLLNGVRIFEYQPRFLHAKTILCDDWVTTGSSNFDRWNLQWNLEANQEIKDPKIAIRIMEMFEKDFENSREYTYQEWHKRSLRMRLHEWFWRKIEILSIKIKRRNRH